jgi:hypothetical protein
LILIVMSIKTLTDGNGGALTTDFHVRQRPFQLC